MNCHVLAKAELLQSCITKTVDFPFTEFESSCSYKHE